MGKKAVMGDRDRTYSSRRSCEKGCRNPTKGLNVLVLSTFTILEAMISELSLGEEHQEHQPPRKNKLMCVVPIVFEIIKDLLQNIGLPRPSLGIDEVGKGRSSSP
jgi:hypothetical protein